MQVINSQLHYNIENLYKENKPTKTQIALIMENLRTYSSAVTAYQAAATLGEASDWC